MEKHTEPGRKEEIPISDINYLVERLEKLLSEAWRIPLSTYLIVNEDEFLDVIDQIRTAIPKEVKQAERLLIERERTIAEGQEEAGRIVQAAREEVSRLVEEHEIVNAANQRAQTIVERAHREAETLKGEADEYARGVLIALDKQLGGLQGQIDSLMTIVRNGLDKLSQTEEPTQDE